MASHPGVTVDLQLSDGFVDVVGEGLEPGERVITSPYTGFADKSRLDLEA